MWVGIACGELAKIRFRCRDAVKTLEKLPRGLHSLYQELLETALGKDKRTIIEMLNFVAISRPLLTVAELSISEACQLYQDEDEEDRLNFTREDIEISRFLVVQGGIVHPLHESVRDFLINSGGGSLINDLEAHAALAIRCI